MRSAPSMRIVAVEIAVLDDVHSQRGVFGGLPSRAGTAPTRRANLRRLRQAEQHRRQEQPRRDRHSPARRTRELARDRQRHRDHAALRGGVGGLADLAVERPRPRRSLTITPRSPSTARAPIAAAASRIMLNVPIRLMRMTVSKTSSGCGPSRPTTRLATPTPAQLTRMRAGPCAPPPCDRRLGRGGVGDVARDREAADRLGGFLGRRRVEIEDRDARALAASASAVARPSPEPPPVTIAAAPESFIASSPSPKRSGGIPAASRLQPGSMTAANAAASTGPRSATSPQLPQSCRPRSWPDRSRD